jgi:hypothetical protein
LCVGTGHLDTPADLSEYKLFVFAYALFTVWYHMFQSLDGQDGHDRGAIEHRLISIELLRNASLIAIGRVWQLANRAALPGGQKGGTSD